MRNRTRPRKNSVSRVLRPERISFQVPGSARTVRSRPKSKPGFRLTSPERENKTVAGAKVPGLVSTRRLKLGKRKGERDLIWS